MAELIAFAGDYPVLGQDFEDKDLSKIREHLETLGMEDWNPKPIIDLYLFSRKSLPKQAEEFAINYEHNFNALEDACVAMEIYEEYKRRM